MRDMTCIAFHFRWNGPFRYEGGCEFLHLRCRRQDGQVGEDSGTSSHTFGMTRTTLVNDDLADTQVVPVAPVVSSLSASLNMRLYFDIGCIACSGVAEEGHFQINGWLHAVTRILAGRGKLPGAIRDSTERRTREMKTHPQHTTAWGDFRV